MIFVWVLMTILSLFAHTLPGVDSAPIASPQLPSIEISWVTDTVVSEVMVTKTAIDIITLLPPSALTQPRLAQITDTVTASKEVTVTLTDVVTATAPALPPPVVAPPPPSTTTSISTSTVLETQTAIVSEPPVTVTVSEPPTTITEIVSIPVTASSTPTQPPDSAWAAPAQFTDLSEFGVTHFACGEDNLKVVSDVPASASAGAAAPGQTGDSNSVLRLFYPAGSVNPGSNPQGGADFYAKPLALAQATSVTLSYSVFFPADFDWVQGGKLPGLYGGHEECSGGDDARECFSTRLMWRKDGAGELYLYAPKDKQTDALCSAPPTSVCDAAYGLSVSRGAFHFTAGAWTNVRQTVTLNTPGQQDGGFTLEVDGVPVISRTDVFYRDVPSASPGAPGSGDDQGEDATSASEPTPTPPGVLGPLLGGILGTVPSGLRARQMWPVERPALLPEPTADPQAQSTDAAAAALIDSEGAAPSSSASTTAAPTATAVEFSPVASLDSPPAMPAGTESLEGGGPAEPIKFSGLFFSTFFGGNSADFATPRDQFSWFKDFEIAVNS